MLSPISKEVKAFGLNIFSKNFDLPRVFDINVGKSYPKLCLFQLSFTSYDSIARMTNALNQSMCWNYMLMYLLGKEAVTDSEFGISIASYQITRYRYNLQFKGIWIESQFFFACPHGESLFSNNRIKFREKLLNSNSYAEINSKSYEPYRYQIGNHITIWRLFFIYLVS